MSKQTGIKLTPNRFASLARSSGSEDEPDEKPEPEGEPQTDCIDTDDIIDKKAKDKAEQALLCQLSTQDVACTATEGNIMDGREVQGAPGGCTDLPTKSPATGASFWAVLRKRQAERSTSSQDREYYLEPLMNREDFPCCEDLTDAEEAKEPKGQTARGNQDATVSKSAEDGVEIGVKKAGPSKESYASMLRKST